MYFGKHPELRSDFILIGCFEKPKYTVPLVFCCGLKKTFPLSSDMNQKIMKNPWGITYSWGCGLIKQSRTYHIGSRITGVLQMTKFKRSSPALPPRLEVKLQSQDINWNTFK